ncbi:MAG: prolipoprotein diacylglyceryl transferase [Acidimicrobiia bacterium]|nr:prolipoprotein diacylglyceryl transferase [Acidimicrobiia bacterium]
MSLPDVLAYLAYDPTVRIGGLVSPHGIGIGVGFLVGGRVMLRRASERGIDEERVYGILFRALIGAIIGARLFWVVSHPSEAMGADGWVGLFMIWRGGLTLLGGIAGAVIASTPYVFRERLDVWRVFDAAAFGLPVGIFIGRIGDLIVGDHLGTATSFFLGYQCGTAETAVPCQRGDVLSQPAFYDLASLVLLMGFLYWLERRGRERYAGFYILIFTVWYAVGRVIEDVYRSRMVDKVLVADLTASQVTSIVFGLAALYVLVFVRHTPRLPAALRRSPGRHVATPGPDAGDDGVGDAEGDRGPEASGTALEVGSCCRAVDYLVGDQFGVGV